MIRMYGRRRWPLENTGSLSARAFDCDAPAYYDRIDAVKACRCYGRTNSRSRGEPAVSACWAATIGDRPDDNWAHKGDATAVPPRLRSDAVRVRGHGTAA